MTYTPYDHDFARDYARDAHLSPDEIETRRMGQLLALSLEQPCPLTYSL